MDVSYIVFLMSIDMNVVKGLVMSKVKVIKYIVFIGYGLWFYFY